MSKINKPGVVKQIKGLPSKASILGLDGYAKGGLLAAGGDDVPAQITDDKGNPLSPASIKEGEFVFSVDAIVGAGNGDYDKGLELITQLHDQLRQRGMEQNAGPVR